MSDKNTDIQELTPQQRAETIKWMKDNGFSQETAEYAADMAEGKVAGDEIAEDSPKAA